MACEPAPNADEAVGAAAAALLAPCALDPLADAEEEPDVAEEVTELDAAVVDVCKSEHKK